MPTHPLPCASYFSLLCTSVCNPSFSLSSRPSRTTHPSSSSLLPCTTLQFLPYCNTLLFIPSCTMLPFHHTITNPNCTWHDYPTLACHYLNSTYWLSIHQNQAPSTVLVLQSKCEGRIRSRRRVRHRSRDWLGQFWICLWGLWAWSSSKDSKEVVYQCCQKTIDAPHQAWHCSCQLFSPVLWEDQKSRSSLRTLETVQCTHRVWRRSCLLSTVDICNP